MQTRQLWLEIKGIVHLNFHTLCVPPTFLTLWCSLLSAQGHWLKYDFWVNYPFMTKCVSIWKFCIHPHSPTTSVFSWVESPHYDFALILLVILLFVFYNYSNGTKRKKKKKRVEDCLVALGFNILSLEIWIYKAGCCNHSLFKEKKLFALKLVY